MAITTQWWNICYIFCFGLFTYYKINECEQKIVTLLEQNKIRSADVSVNVSIYDVGELSYNDKQNISLPCNDQNM